MVVTTNVDTVSKTVVQTAQCRIKVGNASRVVTRRDPILGHDHGNARDISGAANRVLDTLGPVGVAHVRHVTVVVIRHTRRGDDGLGVTLHTNEVIPTDPFEILVFHLEANLVHPVFGTLESYVLGH